MFSCQVENWQLTDKGKSGMCPYAFQNLELTITTRYRDFSTMVAVLANTCKSTICEGFKIDDHRVKE